MLSKQAILAAQDIQSEDVSVPEWGGIVRVKALSGAERDRFEESLSALGADGKRLPAMDNLRAKLCALAMVDENGSRLFEDNEVALLGAKSSAALDRVFAVAQRLNAVTAQDVEKLAGNSGAAPSGDFTSVSA